MVYISACRSVKLGEKRHSTIPRYSARIGLAEEVGEIATAAVIGALIIVLEGAAVVAGQCRRARQQRRGRERDQDVGVARDHDGRRGAVDDGGAGLVVRE